MPYLVTAVISPVACKVAVDLLNRGHQVLGTVLPGVQHTGNAVLSRLLQHPGFTLIDVDLCSRVQTMRLFERFIPNAVLHLGGPTGLCLLGQSGQHCIDKAQRIMLNLLDAGVRWQSRHFVYCQAVSLYDEHAHGIDRHPALLQQVEAKMQLLAHTYSLWHRFCTSGVCFSAPIQYGVHPTKLPQRYYGRDVDALAHQLIQVLQMGPILLQQVNPYFALYPATVSAKPILRWTVHKPRQQYYLRNSHYPLAISVRQQKFSQ